MLSVINAYVRFLGDNRLNGVRWQRLRMLAGGLFEGGAGGGGDEIGLRVIAGVTCHRIGQIDQHQEGDGERQAAEDDAVHVQIGGHLVDG